MRYAVYAASLKNVVHAFLKLRKCCDKATTAKLMTMHTHPSKDIKATKRTPCAISPSCGSASLNTAMSFKVAVGLAVVVAVVETDTRKMTGGKLIREKAITVVQIAAFLLWSVGIGVPSQSHRFATVPATKNMISNGNAPHSFGMKMNSPGTAIINNPWRNPAHKPAKQK